MQLQFFTCENRELLLKTLKLRHKCSTVEDKCNTFDFECDGMTFDQYDTPFAYYVACLVNDEVIGCLRLTRTDIPYMMKDVCIKHIPAKYLAQNKDIYEITRLYVDSGFLSTNTRNKITHILNAFAYLELAKMGGKEMHVVTYEAFCNSLVKLGFDAAILCDIQIDGYKNIKYCRAIVDLQNCQNVEKIMNNLIESIDFHNE